METRGIIRRDIGESTRTCRHATPRIAGPLRATVAKAVADQIAPGQRRASSRFGREVKPRRALDNHPFRARRSGLPSGRSAQRLRTARPADEPGTAVPRSYRSDQAIVASGNGAHRRHNRLAMPFGVSLKNVRTCRDRRISGNVRSIESHCLCAASRLSNFFEHNVRLFE